MGVLTKEDPRRGKTTMKCPHCGKTIINCAECKYWERYGYINNKGYCTNQNKHFSDTHATFSCAEGEFK
jgi:hypothetical protein